MQLITKTKIKDKIDIHFGITKKGYGWISTYKGITNIGLTDVYNSKINYQLVFKKFLKEQNIDADIKDLTGAFTPIGLRKPIINNNIFYIGDALGACDPLTLSGLRYGLKSGEKCAETIAKEKRMIFKCFAYNLKIKFFFMQIMQKIFYFKPVLASVFSIGCRYFGKLISTIFNNFFVNKK
jgi:flavin-dependent dehydrogenase